MAELITQMLKSGRLAHGLLICGNSGAEFAWNAAQTLLCEKENAPCWTCGACLRVAARQSEAVLLIEPEKNLIKLESAARINQFLALGRITKARVVVVQDAHFLNVQATNAILKLVEEPPEATYFLFVAPDPGLLLPTLRSRLQVVRLRSAERVANEELREWREPAMKYLKGCLERDASAPRELLDAVDGREQAELAARSLQEILRDWSVSGDSELPQMEPFARVELWRKAHQMEADLHQHVDRTLVFENFYHQVRQTGDGNHAVD